MKLLFFLYLTAVVWQDLKTKTIQVIIYFVFAAPALFFLTRMTEEQPGDRVLSVALGIMLLIFSRMTGGAMGAGDGWFFVVSGLYLSFWENCFLFLSGVFFCGIYCLFMVAWGVINGIQVGKRRIAFLPFLLPAGIWMVMR